MKNLFMLLALSTALMACSDSYEQVMEDNASQEALSSEANSEKLQFGKMYAIDQIPEDIYNHVDKETLDKFLQENFSDTDSVFFKKLEQSNKRTQLCPNEKNQSKSLTRYSDYTTVKNIFIGSYSNFNDEIAFSFHADYTCYKDYDGKSRLQDLQISIKQGQFAKEWIFEYQHKNHSVYKVWYEPYLSNPNTSTIGEGYCVDFYAEGIVAKYSAVTGTIGVGKHLFRAYFDGTLPHEVDCVVLVI